MDSRPYASPRPGRSPVAAARAPRRVALAVALWAMLAPAALCAQSQPGLVEAIGPIGLTVSNLDRSIAFFTDILMFETLRETAHDGAVFSAAVGLPGARARSAMLRLGDERLELTEFAAPRGRPLPDDSRSNDRWFQHIAIIVRDMDAAFARLQAHGVRPASRGGPQRLPDWNANAAGIRAYYFRDPDGHFLELLQFPADKGDPKWRRPSAPLFLGIDHTAIVVADTDASVRIYRDILGLELAASGENYGPEQEALNNVPGARLRITTLRAPAGPAIELLQYLSPNDGRPYPPEATPSDLVHWHVTLRCSDPHAAAARLAREGALRVSDEQTASRPAGTAPLMMRDPDGHALRLMHR